MATTAQLNQFHSPAELKAPVKGFLARVMKRLMFANEQRAIFRLEREFGHMLGDQHIRQIKADYVARRKRAGL